MKFKKFLSCATALTILSGTFYPTTLASNPKTSSENTRAAYADAALEARATDIWRLASFQAYFCAWRHQHGRIMSLPAGITGITRDDIRNCISRLYSALWLTDEIARTPLAYAPGLPLQHPELAWILCTNRSPLIEYQVFINNTPRNLPIDHFRNAADSILGGMRPAEQPSLLAALNILRNDTQLSAPDREFYDNAHFLLSRVIEMAAM